MLNLDKAHPLLAFFEFRTTPLSIIEDELPGYGIYTRMKGNPDMEWHVMSHNGLPLHFESDQEAQAEVTRIEAWAEERRKIA